MKIIIQIALLITLLPGITSAVTNVYNIPTITDTKILPSTDISEYQTANSILIQASPGEYTSRSFVVNSNTTLSSLMVTPSNLTSNGNTIPKSNFDIRTVKCWWQGGDDLSVSLTGRYLTGELLLHDNSLINTTNESWQCAHVSNPSGKNYLKLTNGSYTDISSSAQVSGSIVIPIVNRHVRDSDTLQPINLPANFNKQYFITLHIPDKTPPGVYIGTVNITNGSTTIKNLDITVQVLPITLPEPNIEYSLYYRGTITDNGSISSEKKTVEQFSAEMRNILLHGITNPTVYPMGDYGLIQMASIRQQIGINNTNFYYTGIGINDAVNIQHTKKILAPYGVQNLYSYGPDETNLTTYKSQLDAIHAAGGKHFNAQTIGQATAIAEKLDLAIVSTAPSASLATIYHSHANRIFSYDNPQTVPEYPRTFRLNYGLLLWQCDYDGVMNYAYQTSFGDIWNDFDFTLRDHVLAYPTANGVIDTIQWEGFREGINDMRYLAALQKTITANPDNPTSRDAAMYLENLKNSNISNANLDAIRSQMITYIIHIQNNDKHLNITDGIGSGYYHLGQVLQISANISQSGMYFDKWVGDTQYISDVNSSTTTITMPDTPVNLIAVYTTDWYDRNYTHRQILKIDHKKVENSNQINFPILVSITEDELKTISNGGSVVNANGSDIVFTLPDKTLLNDEKEIYDGLNGKLVDWVNIPVLSSTYDTYIIMYYGNSNISTPIVTPLNVWDSHYVGVWHMSDSDFKDSTTHQNNAINTTRKPSIVSGFLGNCGSFNGINSRLEIKNNPSLNVSNITIQAWVNPTNFKQYAYEGIVWKLNPYDPSMSTAYSLTPGYTTNDKSLRLFLTTSSSSKCRKVEGKMKMSTGQWQSVASSYDSSIGNIFYNGITDGSGPLTGIITSVNSNLNIGYAGWYFDGLIDEVRISNAARSADWMRTEYNNQYSPSTFYSIGSQELKLVSSFKYSINVTNCQEIVFADESTGTPLQWSWDFGDGTTSTKQNPKHIYSTAGNYTVKLTVSNAYDTDSQTIEINVRAHPKT